jgi:ubiquinone/menaquinone biosynthesis C-methylase UbiE
MRQNKDYYDEYGPKYDLERYNYYYDFINKEEIAFISAFAKGKKTLEIGCGTGIILSEINKIAKDAKGIDLSEGMLKKSLEKGLNAKIADVTKLPFQDKEFDLVYSCKVLAHVKDIKKALAEIYRVTKDDGVMLLEFYKNPSIKKFSNDIMKREAVFTRYDHFSDIKTYLPKGTEVFTWRGIRIITPHSKLFNIPVLGNLLKEIEKILSRTPLGIFGGYFIVGIRTKVA